MAILKPVTASRICFGYFLKLTLHDELGKTLEIESGDHIRYAASGADVMAVPSMSIPDGVLSGILDVFRLKLTVDEISIVGSDLVCTFSSGAVLTMVGEEAYESWTVWGRQSEEIVACYTEAQVAYAPGYGSGWLDWL